MTRYFDACIAHLGLKTNQYAILRLIYRNADISINALAALTVMDRTTVGRAIRPLERDGLLTVTVDPTDKRSRLLNLTKAGIDVVEKGHLVWIEAQRVFEAKFGVGEAKAMRSAMQQVVATELA
ncbi:MarR family winged helix-turn-helix transcriptional regulator [Rhizorhapis suberifaciens]|uniref:DNA-binding MarR family transcriptional regulator n=1 Tax=Rhizorhapis suberifaciens TaxID=13656 RepID=A0A840HQN7_9SPHN|nr:MarR family winged helix-turn-helix transcriptional regulator [Rhizorhapis suberifaciens]MBB4640183.1 DNA-binding MarR family transcriptional regulator [Rhizorhapis suberifaciens]